MQHEIAGDIVEAGVAEGGGILPALFYLACTGALANRTVYLFDTWLGLPEPTLAQDAGFSKGQFRKNFNLLVHNAEHTYKPSYERLVLEDSFLNKAAKDCKPTA